MAPRITDSSPPRQAGTPVKLEDRTPTPSREASEKFNADERVRAVRMLKQVRAYGVIRHFTDVLMRETKDPVRQVLVARLARDIGRKDHAVRVGRRAYRHDLPMPEIAYPILSNAECVTNAGALACDHPSGKQF